jgi:hypothetical protein
MGWKAMSGPRSFDAVVVGNRETDAWVAYYRHEWGRLLVASVGMVRTGFGMGPLRTLLGAWHVLRANQLWAPIPDNDPDGARTSMRRFYSYGGAPSRPRISMISDVWSGVPTTRPCTCSRSPTTARMATPLKGPFQHSLYLPTRRRKRAR